MKFEELRDRLINDLPKRLPVNMRSVIIQKSDIKKLQGASYQGLIIQQKGQEVGVTLNVTNLYNLLEDGCDYAEILDKALQSVEQGLSMCPTIDTSELINYDVAKTKLSMQAVSIPMNVEMLKNVPHQDMEDIAIVCRLVLDTHDNSATVLVTNGMMNKYGITAEQLFQDAMEYAPIVQPMKVANIVSILNTIVDIESEEMNYGNSEMPMYVASTTYENYGAGVIAYPNFMDKVAEMLGGDFFILPSSIHEVILVPDKHIYDYRVLENMVKEVNETQVEPEERLSDKVYHYSNKKRMFECADKYYAQKYTL